MIKYKGDELTTSDYAIIRVQEVYQDIIDELIDNYDIDEDEAVELVEQGANEYLW